MPDDIFSINTPPEETKPDPVLEAINGLKTQIETMGSRIDEFETKISGASEEEPEEEEQEEDWKPNTWNDIPKKAEEIARTIVEETEAQKEEARQQAEEQKVNEQKAIDSYLDEQVSTLEKNGILPQIKNDKDENDPGRAARRELFGFAARFGTMDLQAASEVVSVLHKSGITYDPKANNMKGEFIRGGSTHHAPIASSSGSGGGFSSQAKYKDIANANSLDALIAAVEPDLSSR